MPLDYHTRPPTENSEEPNITYTTARLNLGASRDISSSSDFWATLVVGCYQFDTPNDADPDGIATPPPVYSVEQDGGGAVFGLSPDLYFLIDLNIASVYLETLRDRTEAIGASSMTTDETHTTVHEIGHTAGSSSWGHQSSGIMQEEAPKDQNTFDPASLDRFRSIPTW